MTSLSVRLDRGPGARSVQQDAVLERCDVLGVSVTAAEPEAIRETIVAWAEAGRAATVDFMPVHGLMVAAGDPVHRARLNAFDIVAADGQPVRWAMNLLHVQAVRRRTYGPHMMLDVCDSAARLGLPIYLYGGKPEVVEKLRDNLCRSYPGLKIVGVESPPFRPLTPDEDEQVVRRINASGARIVFIGLGCPRQEVFAYEHRHRIDAVQLCVGAAFDMHAGTLAMAPVWMQARGLEWLYRLSREPGRLWKRYLVTNTQFVLRLIPALLRRAFATRAGGV
jgi:N-acetylglucosaminyldiphosphoundecaprenol N-acetyl-beta-D-mannosaminyltransferase